MLNANVIPLISGFAAGTSVSISLHPIDTLKTRLQNQMGHSHSSPGLYSGLFRGAGFSICAYSVGTATFFAVYEQAKKLNYSGSHRFWIEVPSAILASSIALIWETPFEVAKQRSQRQLRSGETIWRNMSYIGARPFLMREIAYKVLQYPTYEQLKRIFVKENSNQQVLMSSLCGSLAACFSGFLTTPIDVVKTKVMCGYHEKFAVMSTSEVMSAIVNAEGVSGLFKGVLPRMVWFSFAGIIFFGTYEFTNSLLLKQSKKMGSAQKN